MQRNIKEGNVRHIEDNLQRTIIRYLRLKGIMVFAVPNGGSRNVREAHNLKLSGVLAGVSDLIILMQKRAVFVELKTDKGRQSEYQKKFQQDVESLGFEYLIWRSLDDCIKFVNNL